ncbi:MAG: hypothetical protein U1B80_04755 [Anaerolineaceae bacterium]|nr:hypothetical protein [Anaerolineaceae bacterium]
MAEEVFMDIPAVQKMADSFNTFSDVLKGVSKALEAALMILRATAFVGLIGGAVVERWISLIKPNVDKMAAKMAELNSDVVGAIRSYRDGDNSGSSRFR